MLHLRRLGGAGVLESRRESRPCWSRAPVVSVVVHGQVLAKQARDSATGHHTQLIGRAPDDAHLKRSAPAGLPMDPCSVSNSRRVRASADRCTHPQPAGLGRKACSGSAVPSSRQPADAATVASWTNVGDRAMHRTRPPRKMPRYSPPPQAHAARRQNAIRQSAVVHLVASTPSRSPAAQGCLWTVQRVRRRQAQTCRCHAKGRARRRRRRR